jgi:DNA repair protein RadC
MKNFENPREKMMQYGLSSLSDPELLSVFFRKNKLQNALKVLSGVDYSLHTLARMTVHEMMTNCGVSETEAVYVVLAMELGRRRSFQEAVDKGIIKGSKDVSNYFQPKIGDLHHEEFWVLFLNRRNAVLNSVKLSQGGMTGTVIDVRLVLKAALENHSTSLIFCHNHPSGNLEPSDADKRITRQLKEAAAIMEIPVIDHVIVTQHGYFSFADEGLL